ncbi:hypothetical protein IFO69_08445 [Echinicola sp. CAU 1574]|uniref:Uncharacterized protein n=1 Tax=Echinicola arenosa TaxID=2774144 RepID=A0ABR9AIZ7_9BACT|nr:hypothetical protein [Echinicola arenosa]MBD8488771.1 hypothetical protein [Echinicola arenosa]
MSKKNEKLTKKQFRKLRRKYGKEIGKGYPGVNKKGKEIKDQTEWIWFSRKEIEEVLSKTDAEKGGIKFYFGEYDESFESILGEEYVGRLTLAMVPSNKEGEKDFVELGVSSIDRMSLMAEEGEGDGDDEEEDAYNFGNICPPTC